MANFFTDMKDLIIELTDNIDTLKQNADRVQTKLVATQKVAQDIQTKVTEFQTSAQPQLDKINELLENINKKMPNNEKTN